MNNRDDPLLEEQFRTTLQTWFPQRADPYDRETILEKLSAAWDTLTPYQRTSLITLVWVHLGVAVTEADLANPKNMLGTQEVLGEPMQLERNESRNTGPIVLKIFNGV